MEKLNRIEIIAGDKVPLHVDAHGFAGVLYFNRMNRGTRLALGEYFGGQDELQKVLERADMDELLELLYLLLDKAGRNSVGEIEMDMLAADGSPLELSGLNKFRSLFDVSEKSLATVSRIFSEVLGVSRVDAEHSADSKKNDQSTGP